MKIRTATNADSASLICFIDSVYKEYGDTIYTENADRDLLDIEAHYTQEGGVFVVLEDADNIVGSHATLPIDQEKHILTLKRLYLREGLRGRGYGAHLMNWALTWAKTNGYRRIEFWSDTRFTRAHTFFTKFGFKKGDIRHMTNGCVPYSEYGFHLKLCP